MRALLLLSALLLVACGGSSTTATTGDTDHPATAGGEVTAAQAAAIPTTTPIPVPQPVTPRDHLSQPLQQVWTLVETAVEVRPPDAPAEGTREAIEAWASGPFHDWVVRRGDAVHAVEGAGAPLQAATGAERGVAAALFGFLYEETAAGARGAPVPADLAADTELLHIYSQALLESLQPYAQASAEAYAACVAAFQQLADGAWSEWGQYCLDRGREVVEIYQLGAAPPAAAPPPPPADAPH